MPTIELWLLEITDPRTGKRRRTTYRLTIEEARARYVDPEPVPNSLEVREVNRLKSEQLPNALSYVIGRWRRFVLGYPMFSWLVMREVRPAESALDCLVPDDLGTKWTLFTSAVLDLFVLKFRCVRACDERGDEADQR